MLSSTSLNAIAELVLAQSEGAQPGDFLGTWGNMLPIVLMFGVVYFLLIRPANKQRQKHSELLNTLKKDDEIVTNGGIYGKIIALDDKVATVEIADKVKIRILRDRIAGIWNPAESQPQK